MKVKSCPFCGSTEIQPDSREVYETILKSTTCAGSTLSLGCNNCDAEARVYTTKESYEEALKLVVDKWNSRQINDSYVDI